MIAGAFEGIVAERAPHGDTFCGGHFGDVTAKVEKVFFGRPICIDTNRRGTRNAGKIITLSVIARWMFIVEPKTKTVAF